MPISMFDQFVFGSLVLTALMVSTFAQAAPPDSDSSAPAMRVYTPAPRTAPQPQVGFNPQFRPIIKHDPPK